MEDSAVAIQRQEKAENLKSEGYELFPNDFRPENSVQELRDQYEEMSGEELEKVETFYSVAGRIMAKRDSGKSVFFDIMDSGVRIQGFLSKKEVDEKTFTLMKKLDIGDIVGISGRILKTRSGELTILVGTLVLVTKSLLPMPEKFHDMSVELKQRQRYLDLIMNEKTRDVFLTRTKIISLMRRFLEEKSFLEVETPMMQPIPGGATARPFETYHQALDRKLFLRIAPELYLKRLLVGGFNRVYELNRNFRNEGISTKHNPEFTMLEFYQAYASYEDLMDMTEELFTYIRENLDILPNINYQDVPIDMASPWTRIGFHDSLVEVGELPAEINTDKDKALALCEKMGLNKQNDDPHGKLLAKLFDVVVEPRLINPTFIVGYPTDISPLARKNRDNPLITDRFELFIGGREIANGFSELNDPLDQRERFMAQVEEKSAGDAEAHYMDEDYVRALMHGMPPAAGEGIGIDRLVMLFTDSSSIRDVILFPHLREEQ